MSAPVDPYSVRSFEEFWPHYAALHSRRETQWMHALASGTCVTLLALGLSRRSLPLLVLAPLADYAIAQASHRLFEKNRTLPWKNTLWHTRAEFRMLRRVLTGQMSRRA